MRQYWKSEKLKQQYYAFQKYKLLSIDILSIYGETYLNNIYSIIYIRS